MTLSRLSARLRRPLSCLALACLLAGAAAAQEQILITETFDSSTIGAPPSGWTTTAGWQVTSEGSPASRLATLLDADSGTGRPVSRTFTSISKSWILEFDHSWRWGGHVASGTGFHSFILDADVLDAAGDGYRVRIRQGTREGSGNPSANAGKLVELMRVSGASATVLAHGVGYDRPGWRGLGLPAVEARKIRLGWDHRAKRLTAWRDMGGGWEPVASATDPSPAASFSNLRINPSSFNGSCAPQIDNIRLVAPTELIWGVCGHPDVSPYSTIGAAAQIQKVKQLGMTHYRVDVRGTDSSTFPKDGSAFYSVLKEARTQGVKVLPILFAPVSRAEIRGDNTPALTLAELYTRSKTKGKDFAEYYKARADVDRFTHVEIENEIEMECLLDDREGEFIADYDPDVLARIAAVLKGLSDGLNEGDASIKRIVGTAGWYHYGFLDAIIHHPDYPVPFGTIAWHWYSDCGSMQRVMKKLSAYGKPIWLTEFSRKYGAMDFNANPDKPNASTRVYDPFNTTIGASWTQNGSWAVEGGAATCTASSSAIGGVSLVRSVPSTAGASLTLELATGWRWGGNTTTGNGGNSLWSDIDLIDASNNGYRLRVRQGTGGDSSKASKLMQLYPITGGVAAATPVAEGAGLNRPGWQARGLGAPDLGRVRFRHDTVLKKIEVFYATVGGDWIPSFTHSNPAALTPVTLALRTGAFGATERPQFDAVKIIVPTLDENDLSVTLAEMAADTSQFPLVQALFVYELLDEHVKGPENPESHYGLLKASRDAANTTWLIAPDTATTRPAFGDFAAYLGVRGVLPAPGEIVIDDSTHYPAFNIEAGSGAWTYETTPAGSENGGHLAAPVAPAGAYKARYSPVIATTGTYTVSIKVPASASNATSVPITIRHAGGVANITRDFTALSGWVVLGDYVFNACEARDRGATNTYAYVEIGNGTGGVTRIDAVRFSRPRLAALPAWRAFHFGSIAAAGDAADLADPDGDGMVNLLEYALGGSPRDATSAPRPTVAFSAGPGSPLALSFVRAQADVTYIVQGSDDLRLWNDLATYAPDDSPSAIGRLMIFVDAAPPDPNRFLRLKISLS